MTNGRSFSFEVAEAGVGQRLDVLIADHLPDCTRSRASALIRDGHVQVNGAPQKPSYRLKAGDAIRGEIPPPSPVRFDPEPMDLDVLFEDDALLAINKPPDLVVHPAPGHPDGTLVNGILHHCPDLPGIRGERRPGIVHRLDKDTSGVLIVAKTERAMSRLAAAFKGRTVEKTYLAIVHGSPGTESGRITLPVGRHPRHRKQMAAGVPGGRAAESRWTVRERYPGAALLRVRILTGRTHQIRVHLSAIGHPVMGDPIYGRRHPDRRLPTTAADAVRSLKRQMLHAHRLRLAHPETGEPLAIEAPLPSDLAEMLAVLRATLRRDQP